MVEVHMIQCYIVSILWSLSRKETTVLLCICIVTYNTSKVIPKSTLILCMQLAAPRALILFTLIELFDGVQELVFVACVNLVFLLGVTSSQG